MSLFMVKIYEGQQMLSNRSVWMGKKYCRFLFVPQRAMISNTIQLKQNLMADPSDQFKHQVIKKHVLKYCQPSDFEAWKAIGMTVVYQLLSIALIRNHYLYLGWFVNTLVIVRMFVQFHDMAHFSFFKSIALNKIVGSLFGVYVHFPFQAWRDGHNHHHKHFGNLDRKDLSQTILFTKKQYEAMPKVQRGIIRFFREPVVFFLFTAPFVWFFGTILIVAKRYGMKSKPFFQKIASLVFVFFILPLLGVSAWHFSLSIWGTNLIGTILFHLQHSVNLPYRQHKQQWNFDKAALQGSTFLQIPYLLKPFTNGIEYHHIHHLNTNVASYAIEQCHNSWAHMKGQTNNWQGYGINQVNLWLGLRSLANVMLDEQQIRLIPFNYH